ncbi:hypothetical protein C8F04DRAFT_1258002 [Mycena alexandri]|uniref:Uncharacterized protein n=1 Tax=Mycena alexandri TaxID=1745969 RepID=A0AAD6SYK3_9AGAR|nr:hypothetical protein C8F04DRAFT_1258002 [Mycena alexandri]
MDPLLATPSPTFAAVGLLTVSHWTPCIAAFPQPFAASSVLTAPTAFFAGEAPLKAALLPRAPPGRQAQSPTTLRVLACDLHRLLFKQVNLDVFGRGEIDGVELLRPARVKVGHAKNLPERQKKYRRCNVDWKHFWLYCFYSEKQIVAVECLAFLAAK